MYAAQLLTLFFLLVRLSSGAMVGVNFGPDYYHPGELTDDEPPTKYYYVWPKDGRDKSANEDISSQLEAWVPAENAINFCQVGVDLSWVLFWQLNLTEDQAAHLRKLKTVRRLQVLINIS